MIASHGLFLILLHKKMESFIHLPAKESEYRKYVCDFLSCFKLWSGLLESFFGCPLKELRCNCGFGVVGTGVQLFDLNWGLLFCC